MKYCIIGLLFIYSCAGTAQTQKTDIQTIEKATQEKTKQTEEEELTPQSETLPFELVEASSQKFSGGAPGSNTVYMYQIKLKKLTDKSLSFKALWTSSKDLSLDFQLKRKFQADDWANYKNEDELMLFAQKTKYGSVAKEAMKKQKTDDKIKGKKAPYTFKSAGLIEYELDGNTHYYELEKIANLPSVGAP